MRILLYCPNYFPATKAGGPIRSSHGLARALVAHGHDVEVLTTNVDGDGIIDVPLGEAVSRDGVMVRYFPVQAPRRLYYAPALARAASERVLHCDIVHSNGMFLWPGPRVAAIARRARVPVVVAPRGMLVPELVAGRSTLAKRIWIALYERRHLAEAAAVHVTSEREAEDVRRMGLAAPNLTVVGNGVDAPDAMPTDAQFCAIWGKVPRGCRVAFLGRLDWTKGVDLAIAAVARVPGARLVVAGPDQIGLRTRLEPTVPQDDGEPVARFIGSVDGAEKWALLAGADVVVAPSVRESFGMAVAEALAVGTPVVCTQGVGAASIIRPIEPAAVVAREAEPIANAIETLLRDPERCARYGDAAQEVMWREHSWAAVAQRMTRVYADVCANQQRPAGGEGETPAAAARLGP